MQLTKERILERIDERFLYQYYFPQKIVTSKNIYTSPFRHDRKAGSCHFNWWRGRFLFFDKASGTYHDVFELIMYQENCGFYDALNKVNNDFDLGLEVDYNRTDKEFQVNIDPPEIVSPFPYIDTETNYWITNRDFESFDLKYWNSYNISESTLNKYDVSALQKVKYNKTGSKWRLMYSREKHQDPCYAYKIYTDEKLLVKLYRPYSKEMKWASSRSDGNLFGYDQLPDTGEVIYITSSMKDGMVLSELGLDFVAPWSEGSTFNFYQIRDIKNRFKYVIVLYDRDQAGISAARKTAQRYDVNYMDTPYVRNGSKDIADISRSYGLNTVNNLIWREEKKLKSSRLI